ncbi:PQQ-binding-like beta-propeller repeat protein [Sodalis-like endosymbiont of Proechinophthirus fluctus]|uniref:PQQ-binding-like beta-propeller repeat protein n=1 Tax=Sodalis-like endosymbiont of Proechinophthirus fluctus TaxID=1462730 RepID=UPI00164FB106
MAESVFISATADNYMCAIDAHTGKIVWQARLPKGGIGDANVVSDCRCHIRLTVSNT